MYDKARYVKHREKILQRSRDRRKGIVVEPYPNRLRSDIVAKIVETARSNPDTTVNEMASLFLVGRSTVLKYLAKAGVRLTKKGYEPQYRINEEFFDQIDTPVKAQVLGLIYADGSMSKHSKSLVSIRLAQEDEDYLVQINRVMGHDKPLYYVDRTFMVSPLNGKTYKCQRTVILDITRQKMYKRLQQLGVCVNKTRVDLGLPDIPKDMVRWFVLGLFEGDGTITHSLTSTGTILSKTFSIALSHRMGEGIRNHLDQTLGVGKGNLHQVTGVWVLSYASTASIVAIMDWLYAVDTGLRMTRKHEKWLILRALIERAAVHRPYTPAQPLAQDTVSSATHT